MIPKIIHYCWLSGEAFPENIQRCFDSWSTELKDYEIWLWDTSRFDIDSLLWTSEAFKARKYAFAADYIRLYALYNYGGIYLDSDVLVYKCFDDLLELPYFLGEDYVHCFEPAIIGAMKGCPWIKRVMDIYYDRHFVRDDGSYDFYGLPRVFHDRLVDKYTFHLVSSKEDFINRDDSISIFSYDFFNSRDYCGPRRFPNSYCTHYYIGSWMDKRPSWKEQIRRRLPRSVMNLYYKVVYITMRETMQSIQIPFEKK